MYNHFEVWTRLVSIALQSLLVFTAYDDCKVIEHVLFKPQICCAFFRETLPQLYNSDHIEELKEPEKCG